MQMKNVLDVINLRKHHLNEHSFFEILRAKDFPSSEKLSFASGMFFYVLAFKDLLTFLQTAPTDNPLQQMINAYVGEDGDHYAWYIDDLNRAGIPLPQAPDLWHPKLLESRKTIYRLIGYALQESDLAIKVAMVMVFEATGDIFLRHCFDVSQALGLEKKLKYFGELHFQDERSHTILERDLVEISLPDDIGKKAIDIVNTCFDDYDALFNCWLLWMKMEKNRVFLREKSIA